MYYFENEDRTDGGNEAREGSPRHTTEKSV